MRAFLVLAFAVVITGLGLGVVGCNDLGVGRVCLNPGGDNSKITGTQISSPALECRTRLCLLQQRTDPLLPGNTCTARCDTNADCLGALVGDPKNGQCSSKFVCAVATKTGPFACQTICMCQDDVEKMVNGDPGNDPTGADKDKFGCPQSCGGNCKTASTLQ